MTEEEHKLVGHCGRMFEEFGICEECKIDDLCQGCCMNDEDEEDESERKD